MKDENLDIQIKVIHEQIQRLMPDYNELKTEFENLLKEPDNTEFFVVSNEKQKSLLRLFDLLLNLYKGWQKAVYQKEGEEKDESDEEDSYDED